MTQAEARLMLMTYQDAPTYQQYEDPEQQWLEWKRQANTLPIAEVARHASVSTSNRHSCRNCFCCAALAVLTEKQIATGVRRG